jgi:hypothetical protein
MVQLSPHYSKELTHQHYNHSVNLAEKGEQSSRTTQAGAKSLYPLLSQAQATQSPLIC